MSDTNSIKKEEKRKERREERKGETPNNDTLFGKLSYDIVEAIFEHLYYKDMFITLSTCTQLLDEYYYVPWDFMQIWDFPDSIIDDLNEFKRAVKAHNFYTTPIYILICDFKIMDVNAVRYISKLEAKLKELNNSNDNFQAIQEIKLQIEDTYKDVPEPVKKHLEDFKEEYTFQKINTELYGILNDDPVAEDIEKWITGEFTPDYPGCKYCTHYPDPEDNLGPIEYHIPCAIQYYIYCLY